MKRPSMVIYKTEAEYFEHYKNMYCRNKIYTPDNIRVYFSAERFNHAFFEGKIKAKNFSFARARFIDWIKYTLESSDSELYQGYCSDTKCMLPNRRVAVVKNDKYVVVIEMFYKAEILCAKFKTAFYADKLNTYKSIQKSPKWTIDACRESLREHDKKTGS